MRQPRTPTRIPALGASITALALLVTGCSDASPEAAPASDAGSAADSSGDVPAGVAEQYATLAAEIDAEGGRTRTGDWEVAYIVEPAEPWFETGTGQPSKRDPAPEETHHIEIIPFEAATGRIVPDVPIHLEVVDGSGEVVDEADLDFFHAEFFHYAQNFSVPEEGTYTLRASLQPPQYLRHGDSLEDLTLLEPATVAFEGVELRDEG